MKEKKYKEKNSMPLEYDRVELPADENEDTIENKEQHYLELFLLIIFSIIAAYTIFMMDIGIDNLSDLLSGNMVLAALIYAFPTFMTSSFLYEKLVTRYSRKMSVILSLVVCIPLVYLLIMAFIG